jgi:F-type H+-transporting ATPase subunit a
MRLILLTAILNVLAIIGLSQAAFAQDPATHNEEQVHSEATHEEAHEAEDAHGGKFKPGDMIMHHVADAHSIHIIGEISIPLPVILYTEQGIDIFSSSNLYKDHHESFYTSEKTGNTYCLEHEHIYFADADGKALHDVAGPMDLSITKSVFGMLFIMVLMVIFFVGMAKKYKDASVAPKGSQNLIEPLILFVRNEVAIPSIGAKKADKFMPFLLTVFFFIWMCNMLGLIPFLGGFNLTGTLAITAVLAAFVFIITTINGNGHYWGHILWPPGVPVPIKLILVPIEVAGVFIKPLVLMVRLTANITAGHIIILAFVSLVILFGEQSAVAGYGVGVGAVIFMILMFFIELLVAFLQAYVFTLLAALYFGDATQEAHH